MLVDVDIQNNTIDGYDQLQLDFTQGVAPIVISADLGTNQEQSQLVTRVQVTTFIETITRHVDAELLSDRVERPLGGLRAVCYYGSGIPDHLDDLHPDPRAGSVRDTRGRAQISQRESRY